MSINILIKVMVKSSRLLHQGLRLIRACRLSVHHNCAMLHEFGVPASVFGSDQFRL